MLSWGALRLIRLALRIHVPMSIQRQSLQLVTGLPVYERKLMESCMCVWGGGRLLTFGAAH